MAKKKPKPRVMRKLIAYARVPIYGDNFFVPPYLSRFHTAKEPAGILVLKNPRAGLYRITLTEIRPKPRTKKKSK